MAGINLLPQELKPKAGVLKLSKTLNKLALVSVGVLLSTTIVLIGSFIFFSQQSNASVERQENLQSEIRALEQTEQRLILVKDRLSKINKILSSGSVASQIELLKKVLAIMPSEVLLQDLEITDENVRIEVSSGSLSGIGQFFLKILQVQDFRKVNVDGFSFRNISGYVVVLEFYK
jgi:hypothetical protein